MKTERSSGILLHPTSLPGKYGIGTLGREAMIFIDFLVKAKQKIWQILPLGPTGYADSPYQCFSSNAGNPLLIDFDQLASEGLLTGEDLRKADVFPDGPVDYGKVIMMKYPLLKKAEKVFNEKARPEYQKDYQLFCLNNASWLDDYSLFISIKEHFGLRPWFEWEPELKMRNKSVLKHYQNLFTENIEFQKFIQFIFFRQWSMIREYAQKHDILIMGDIPLYVAHDSVDAWMYPEIFQFDEKKDPIAVGGVPPDYFSETGQLWGNPLYRWDALKDAGYSWWIQRIKANLVLFDMIRIDHFRGFAGYWSVPFGEKTAIKGKWVPGPGKDLFLAIRNELGDVRIVAEDLGVMTEDVEDLRDSFGFPGMKILQFAFDSSESNDYLPYNFLQNCIVYTGTHDNDTIIGWFKKAKKEDRASVLEYMNTTAENIHWDFIRLAWASVAKMAIVPMQDLLGLGTEARMNLPGTTINNWMWRMKEGQMTNDLAERLGRMTEVYGRSRTKLKIKN